MILFVLIYAMILLGIAEQIKGKAMAYRGAPVAMA